jgi:DNA sulfur modification protein DndD
MYLKSIRLRDWKGYAGDATFEFPRPTKRKNVVLIGAKNGHGKTSLLEALMLGLYGRDALHLVARADQRAGDDDKYALSYDEFLQRALHARALEAGRTSMTVEITLVDEEEEIVSIERTWHFKTSGGHRRNEEDVRLWRGVDREPIRAPKLEDRDDFVRSFVARHLLPVHLAQFFLFDGEQVQRLAQREMAAQVRTGIEGMLGVATLRTLRDDLREYSGTRRRAVTTPGDETLTRLHAEIEELETSVRTKTAESGDILKQHQPLRDRRGQLTRELSSLHGGSIANVKELHERRSRVQRELDRLREQLAGLLSTDLALAVVGRELRDKVRKRLSAEQERAKWEAGKAHSAGQLGRFLSGLAEARPAFEPPLTKPQAAALEGKVRTAWESLWFPPPTNCAESYRHQYLNESDRSLVTRRLDRVDEMAFGALEELMHAIDESDRDVRKITGQLASLEGVEEPIRRITDEMERIDKQEREFEIRSRELDRALVTEREQLNVKRQNHTRMASERQRAEPHLARVALADNISALIDNVIDESLESYVDSVGREMTDVFRLMAHKKNLSEIKIERDCTVRLLAKGGRDLRDLDASAGENQVFSFALIAAIARAATERGFPIVIDTPLARLDAQHRVNILRYFTERAGEQVVLLSQDAEVTGQYLDVVRDRVSQTYLIEHEEIDNGVGVNQVRKGQYFERVV